MPHQWQSYLEWAVLLCVCTLSIFRGAPAERSGALLILTINLASDIAFAISAPHIPQFALFYLDFFLAVGLLIIAFRFSSLWLGAAMLLQSIILFTHALALGDDGLSSYGFVVVNNVVSNLMYTCLLGATLTSWRTRHQRLKVQTTGSQAERLSAVAS